MSFGGGTSQTSQSQVGKEEQKATTQQTGLETISLQPGISEYQQQIQKELGTKLQNLLSGSQQFGMGQQERESLFNLSKSQVEQNYLGEIQRLKNAGLTGGELNRQIQLLRDGYTRDIANLAIQQNISEQELGRQQQAGVLSAASPFALTQTLTPETVETDITKILESIASSSARGKSSTFATSFGTAL